MPNEYQPRRWQIQARILADLMAEYEARKSKPIKYVPTEKELRDAMRFYKLILDLADQKDPNALKLRDILNSVSSIPEEQIKFTGFIDELLKKYPTGQIPTDFLMDIAEKWDVLEYIVTDRLRALGIRLEKLK